MGKKIHSIKTFKRRSSIFAGAIIYACSLSGHAERPDSLPGLNPPEEMPSFMIPRADSLNTTQPLLHSPFSPERTSNYYYGKSLSFRAYNFAANQEFDLNLSAPTSLFAWQSGGINLHSAQTSFPGLAAIESGRISITETMGPLALTAWAGATKYGYFRGLQTSWSFGGQIDYRISDRWSLTAFGEYHSPVHPLSPALAGLMSTSRFGGYASYNINDRWGINIGAQAQRSLVTNRWEAQPIVEPYYRINKSVSIGIDVGGILYNVAKDYLDSRNNNQNAMPRPPGAGRPPTPSPARIAPRR